MLTQFSYEGVKRQVRVHPSYPDQVLLVAEYNNKAKDRLTLEVANVTLEQKREFIGAIYSMVNGYVGTAGDTAELDTLISMMLSGVSTHVG